MLSEYKLLSEQHDKNRKQNSILILLVTIFPILYLLTNWQVWMLGGIVYIAGILFYSHKRNRALYRSYEEIEQKQINLLAQDLKEMEIYKDEGQSAFGYCMDAENLEPSYLYVADNYIYIFNNIFIKNCTYSMNEHLTYCLELDRSVITQGYKVYVRNKLYWEERKDDHQHFLREQGLQLNSLLVMESFIYDDILYDIMNGKKKKPMNVQLMLKSIKKEKLIQTQIEDKKLVLAEDTALRLGIQADRM